MKSVKTVFETTDYSLFKQLKGNRHINLLHLKRLVQSFRSHYLISPIIVNEKMEVVDGQHRLRAAIETNLPVYYIMCEGYGLKEVQILNTNSKDWGMFEYLNGYCDLGNPEYLKFRNFMRRFPQFGIKAAQYIALNRTAEAATSSIKDLKSDTNKKGYYRQRTFEEGKFIFGDIDGAIDRAEKILMIKPYFDGYNSSIFVRAMIGIFKVKGYSHEQLIHKLKQKKSELIKCATVVQYKVIIEDVYNYKSRGNKISLKYEN